MAWLRVRFVVAAQALPRVEELLESIGALSVTSTDAGDRPILEPAPGQTPLWDSCRLEALFEEGTDEASVRAVLGSLDSAPAMIETDLLADADWQNQWRQYAVNDCFGERLWVVPREAQSSGPRVLRLDPGLAFGTGSHPTTRLCLDWLARQPLECSRVLDLGCGSGILALAALTLGCATVYAIDHDPQALLATADNATFNALADERLVLGEPLLLEGDVAPFDVVVANILANPLIELAADITRLTRIGGRMVLSGLLFEQADEVQAAYPDMDFASPASEADEHGALWARLEATRRV